MMLNPRWAAPLAALLLGVGTAPSGAQGLRSGDRERWLLTNSGAFMLGQPELAAAGEVKQAVWSPEGRYVLALRELLRFPGALTRPPRQERELLLWDAEGRRSRAVWSARTPEDAVGQIAWLPRADVALVLVIQAPDPRTPRTDKTAEPAEPETWIVRVDARRGLSRAVSRVTPGSRLHPAPGQPLAVLVDGRDGTQRMVRADGTASGPLALPGKEHELSTFQYWSEDGTAMVVLGVPTPHRRGDRPTWYAVNPLTGAAQALKKAPGRYQLSAPALPWRVNWARAALTDEVVRQPVRPVWLESLEKTEQPATLLCPDAEQVVPSPAGDAVLYVADGAAWVTPVVRAPTEAFYAARAAAMRRELLSQGKQLGIAILMYAQDYNDVLPAAGQAVDAMIKPYLENPELAGRLVYTFGGGTTSALQDTRGTELGYVPGAGGRAVIYADGHIAWKKDGEK